MEYQLQIKDDDGNWIGLSNIVNKERAGDLEKWWNGAMEYHKNEDARLVEMKILFENKGHEV